MNNVSLKDLIDKNKLLTEEPRKTPEEAVEGVEKARRRLIVKWTEKVNASGEHRSEKTTESDPEPSESA